jgi:glucosamine kinase
MAAVQLALPLETRREQVIPMTYEEYLGAFEDSRRVVPLAFALPKQCVMSDTPPFVIGVDGGGTYTRALCADLSGNVLAAAQAGGANPSKNAAAEENLRQAVLEAVGRAGLPLAQVAAFVAGLSGLDEPADQAWAERFTALPGLAVQPHCVNDAVVAWAGALALQPGIIAIGGTGSIVLGVTERGEQIRDYDFRTHSGLMARTLALEVVHQVVAGAARPADSKLVAQVLAHFGAEDAAALADQAAACAALPYEQYVRAYSSLAPALTAAALAGAPLAQAVCDRAAAAMALSIRLVGSRFAAAAVPVALSGGVIRSPYIAARLRDLLAEAANRVYQVVEPALPPEAGAVLMALQQAGAPVGAATVARLAELAPVQGPP